MKRIATAPETIISSFAVVLDETKNPLGVFLFHVNGERDINGEIAQPAGWKLPGGRYEKPLDKTPRHAAQNKTLSEIGLKIEPVKLFNNRDSPYGEALQECKTSIDRKGKTFCLKVYTFLMKITDNAVAIRSFSLADIILMPLAKNTKTGEINPHGIHFSARKRIFCVLQRAEYDFLKLIPNLPELFDKLNRSEVGEDVYWILRDALETSNPKEATPATEHEKTCPCDACWKEWWASRPIRA